MKNKVVKSIIITITTIIVVLLLNCIRINITYQLQKDIFKDSFKIYGNTNHYVPQGLAYSNKYNVILQTSYNGKHEVSKLYIIDFKTGKLYKELSLKEIDESDNINHVGGVATDGETVWITNDYEVNEYSLDEIINTNNNYIKSKKNTKLPIRGDFCYYKDSSLWIGDFFLSPFYKVPNNTPLLMKYNINNIDYNNPELVISLPKMVQGMTITDDNKFIFTRSFTFLINSDLVIYNNVLEEKNDIYEINNNKIPYYHFTDKNKEKNIKLPPMAEGLFYKDKKLFILFENSSDHYKLAIPKNNNMITIKY